MRYRIGVVAVFLLISGALRAEDVLVSPSGNVQFKLLTDPPRARFTVTLNGVVVIEPSPIIMTLDGTDIIDGAKILLPEKSRRDGDFPSRPLHSKARDYYNAQTFKMQHGADELYSLEIRAYDNGIACLPV